ncbi:hypothetical protein DXV75_16185 [Alteromonas aestuariivivens]|uniref:Phytase-like domain-containing protein n=2 Tax=Alteromonas aestuariivivens TaxID=1938339 RepID=A0A3D8M2Q0_9ALTE|nr:hypothetical protein DXV75_16185 [Alteromonas aestuariivivens]
MVSSPPADPVVNVYGKWIKESDGTIMQDPQTSGLTLWQDKLVSISDGSALPHQQRRLHLIEPASATLAPAGAQMTMDYTVRRSCFSEYLANEPDLEAIVADPADPNVFYTVTEDATRTGALSMRCQQKYQDTGSTDYPSLLLRLQLNDSGETHITHVRPLQFPAQLNVGNFPNDGIEGLAMAEDRTLYIGLEKDAAGLPRIFTVTLDEEFWKTQYFAEVQDPGLKLPVYQQGNHPINGLAYYKPENSDNHYLLAAARNDNELWIIDAAGRLPARTVLMRFYAPVEQRGADCEAAELMDNASIEGLVVAGNTLWMVNDPWKVNYLKNLQCPSNQPHYEAMAPLLFGVELQNHWFEG